jgi:hypothetical protein
MWVVGREAIVFTTRYVMQWWVKAGHTVGLRVYGKIGDEETQKRDDRNTTYKRLCGCWQKTLTLPAPCVTTRSCISSLEAMQTPWKRGERDG